jgi:polyferredoxin
MTLVPGLLLAVFSIAAIVFFLRHLLNKPDTVLALVVLQILLGTLWWGWTEIPLFFREAIHRMLQRKRDGGKSQR